MLTGEGADETFTGYQEYLPDVLREADMAWDSGLPEEKRLSMFNAAEAETAGWHDLVSADGEVQSMSEGRCKLNGITTVATIPAFIPSSIFAD